MSRVKNASLKIAFGNDATFGVEATRNHLASLQARLNFHTFYLSQQNWFLVN